MGKLESTDSEERGEALQAVAEKLNKISYDSDAAYPPDDDSGELPHEDFVEGYRLGLHIAAESGLDVLRSEYEVFDNDDLAAMRDTEE